MEAINQPKMQWTPEMVKLSFERYSRNDFIRVVAALWNFQTAQEQASETTIVANGVGFNGLDAKFAASLLEGTKQYGGSMSQKQFLAAKRMMFKYASQLAKVANGTQAVPRD